MWENHYFSCVFSLVFEKKTTTSDVVRSRFVIGRIHFFCALSEGGAHSAVAMHHTKARNSPFRVFSPSLRTKKIDSTRRCSPSYNNKVLQLDAADATTRLFPSVSKLFIWTSFRPFFFCFPFTLHFRSNRKTAFEEQKEAATTEIISCCWIIIKWGSCFYINVRARL